MAVAEAPEEEKTNVKLKELREEQGRYVQQVVDLNKKLGDGARTKENGEALATATHALNMCSIAVEGHVAVDRATKKAAAKDHRQQGIDGQKETFNLQRQVRKGGRWVVENQEIPFAKFGKTINTKNDNIGELLFRPEYRDFFMDSIASGTTFENSGGRLQKYFNQDDCPAGFASADDFADGGWLSTPITFLDQIYQECNELNYLISMATQLNVTAARSLGIRKETDEGNSYARGCVCKGPSDISNPTGQIKTLEPHWFTAATAVCGDLVRHSVLNAESYFAGKLAKIINNGREQQLFRGSGNDEEWEGLLTAELEAERDYPVPTNFEADDFFKMICRMNLCRIRKGGLTWVMNQDTWCQIMTLKDGNGQYLWHSTGHRGLTEGPPNMLVGYPVVLSEFMDPGTAVGQVPFMLVDMSTYYVANGYMMELEKVRQGCKDTTIWISRGYDDGMLVEEQGIVRGKRV